MLGFRLMTHTEDESYEVASGSINHAGIMQNNWPRPWAGERGCSSADDALANIDVTEPRTRRGSPVEGDRQPPLHFAQELGARRLRHRTGRQRDPITPSRHLPSRPRRGRSPTCGSAGTACAARRTRRASPRRGRASVVDHPKRLRDRPGGLAPRSERNDPVGFERGSPVSSRVIRGTMAAPNHLDGRTER
jgi:hypothetical protein